MASATTITIAADRAAKTKAASVLPAKREAAGAGKVRTNVCHVVTRSIAVETPNWKNPTPRTENAAYDARNTLACPSARGSPKSTNKSVGNPSVATLNPGNRTSSTTCSLP